MMDSNEQVRRDTIIEERTGVLNLARRNREATAAHVRAGKLSEETAGIIDRAVFAFAEKVAIGFHVEGDTDVEVRRRLRDVALAVTSPRKVGS